LVRSMAKKAIITVSLLPEAQTARNEIIKREIIKESQIPWCKKIEKVEIEESEDCMVKGLKKHGLSDTVVTNVAKFYRD